MRISKEKQKIFVKLFNEYLASPKQNLTKLTKEIEGKTGFKKLKNIYDVPVFTNGKTVVKIGNLIGCKPKMAIPTKIIKLIKCNKMVIQPKVKKAYVDMIYEPGYGEDAHGHNTCYYRGKLMVFDW